MGSNGIILRPIYLIGVGNLEMTILSKPNESLHDFRFTFLYSYCLLF